ncbi:MAG: pitrilysin family protein [Tepidisphaeraceae bacterium]
MAALVGTFVQTLVAASPSAKVEPIPFERETLDNGLRVIYAPMTNAPVVHVRVIYHVGSRDEAPDRQGFAHMFEHMMFRGSAHVASEQHMKLVNSFGGVCNAFTSYDQTTYHDTIPTNHLETALYLEADRMASFKVSGPVFETERNVVAEEWRLRYANQPYGPMNRDTFATAFKTHNYKWPTIGDMDHLRAANIQELQDFHDKYYIPNNACLIIAGQFDMAQAKQYVHKYFGWMPKGEEFTRATQQEPEQTDGPRVKIVHRPQVPVVRVTLAWKSPAYRNDDHLKLELLTSILGGGRSSRGYQALVGGDDPIAVGVNAGNYQLEDPSLIVASLAVLRDKNPDNAVTRLKAVIQKVIDEGVTQEELDKAKTGIRVSLINGRATAESVGTALGEEEVFGGDANRVNEWFDKLDAITVADIKTTAANYLKDQTLTIVQYLPGKEEASTEPASQPVAPASQPAEAVAKRVLNFPEGYPVHPPTGTDALAASFNKGVPDTVNGVQVLTMTDKRLPVVSVSLVLRSGGHAAAPDKAAVPGLTAQMLTRGAAGQTAQQIAEDLESRGINIGVDDDGDTTRASLFATSDQLDYGLTRFKQILQQPDFPEKEFAKLKQQAITGLIQSLSQPGNVADRELDKLVFGELTPLGRQVEPDQLRRLTLDDVKAWYASVYKPENALLVFSGSIEPEQARALAATLLADWKSDGTPPKANYELPAVADKRPIVLVDNPTGQQSSVRMGLRSYDVTSDDRFAGSVATQILSSGIENRMDRKLRAEKGLTYGSGGYFRPGRHGGSFEVTVDTRPEKTGEAITGAFEVLEEMCKNEITPEELEYAKSRVAGLMVLQTQTVQQQAGRRIESILNGWPADYWDNYASKIAKVTTAQVRAAMEKYVDSSKLAIVVVAPAKAAKEQLDAIGATTVVPMPLSRNAPDLAP